MRNKEPSVAGYWTASSSSRWGYLSLFKKFFGSHYANSAADDTVAVVDVETTGLFPGGNDRIVEIAIVLILPDGEIQTEYETLVNPSRDLGPTRIHGISAQEVLQAPSFGDIAGDVLEIISNATVIAGHNVSFDKRFIVNEYQRLGVAIPDIPLMCTCNLLGRNSLSVCCEEFGITFDGIPHRALVDARATAKLIAQLCVEDKSILKRYRIRDVSWPAVKPSGVACFTRDHAQVLLQKPPAFLQRLAEKMHHDQEATPENILAYEVLIDRILEDRTIDANEEKSFLQAAIEWKLSQDQINQVHTKYVHSLAVLALADGTVSKTELRELQDVARLLGQDLACLDDALKSAAAQLVAGKPNPQTCDSAELAGKKVCFTGDIETTICGKPLTRDVAEALAAKAGLQIANNVSKKLDILVVADPNTQSGKARKARDYGIRILTDTVFWRMIGVSVD